MSTAAAVMSTQEVANRFNELSQTAQYDKIYQELYADTAVSIEPEKALSMGMTNADSLEGIRKKGEAFNAMVEEMHGGYSTEPIVAGNHFSLAMGMDVTMKGVGRTKMDEICVYEVKDGKIIKEQFFY